MHVHAIYIYVQLKGNIALVLYSMLDPQEPYTLYSCSSTHSANKGQVLNHSRKTFTHSYYSLCPGMIATHQLRRIGTHREYWHCFLLDSGIGSY